MIVSTRTANGVTQSVMNRQQLKQWADNRTAHVIAHEQAHLAGLGSIGGSMHLQFGSVAGIPYAQGGHVSFTMPVLDTHSPQAAQRSRALFGMVSKAAGAVGGDMSDADKGVKTSAEVLFGKANIAEQAWSKIAEKSQASGLPTPALKPGYNLNVAA